ncbi:7760_t:CDS:2 [Funneliformis geosporum]|uniref:7760_t:CDS:1 n=1 Tax=Funneliformis geosporum TaxID=1117311 RepID=A0A9W4SDB1_9GLOM|nr:7760_t:CDS:2 [Funneliformis geosporum]
MSQQNNQQNLQTPNLPTVVVPQSQQIASNNSTSTLDQYSTYSQNTQQEQQNKQLQMRAQQQQQYSQQRPQLQQTPQGSPLPINMQSVQQANTDAIGAGRGGTSIRGGPKKKSTNAARKPSTGGGRAKLPSLEKSNTDVLPQALNKMATDFYSQAQQLGLNTEAGSAMYKKYEDAIRAIRQHQVNVNNNQSTSYGISASPDQPSTSTSSPHTIPQYQNIHTPQQLINELNLVQETLSQPNIQPNVKQDYENRQQYLRAIASVRFQAQPGAGGLGAVSHMPPQSPRGLMGPQVVRSPMQANASLPRATMNALGQNRGMGSPAGNDFNRIPTTTQQISSPILQHTSMTSGQSQDGLMNMQQQLGQMSSSLQQVPQSPSTQSQMMVLPHSPRTQQLHMQQLHPLSPRQQHSSQPLQSVANEDLMEIDSDTRSSTLAQKTAESLAASAAAAAAAAVPRQVPPIAPAINTGILQSSLNKIHQIHTGKTYASIYGNNSSYPEISTSNVVDVDMEDACSQHLLPKRKVQQLVDQIDPKESQTSQIRNFRGEGSSTSPRSVRKPVVSVGHQQKLAAVMQAKANKAMTAATGPSN